MTRYFILSLCPFGPVRAGVGAQPHGSPRPGKDPGSHGNKCLVKPSVGCNLAYPDLFPSPRPGNEARPPVVWVKFLSHGERLWRRERLGDGTQWQWRQGNVDAAEQQDSDTLASSVHPSGIHLLAGNHCALYRLPSVFLQFLICILT